MFATQWNMLMTLALTSALCSSCNWTQVDIIIGNSSRGRLSVDIVFTRQSNGPERSRLFPDHPSGPSYLGPEYRTNEPDQKMSKYFQSRTRHPCNRASWKKWYNLFRISFFFSWTHWIRITSLGLIKGNLYM